MITNFNGVRNLTPEEIEKEIENEIEKINKMSRIEMASLWRFAPIGHKYFNENLPFHEIFKKRFDELGGFSPGISKAIGWD